MNKSPKKTAEPKEPNVPQMPFDDALRKILSAPPAHKVAKKIDKQGVSTAKKDK